MTKIVFGVESINQPLTGIGNYSLNLLKGLHDSEEVESLKCFDAENFYEYEEVISRVFASGSTAENTADILLERINQNVNYNSGKFKSTIREFAMKYEFSSQLWRAANKTRGQFKIYSGQLLHEINKLTASYGVYATSHEYRSAVKKCRQYVYHEPNYIVKPFAGKTVTTVHDLSHIHFPQYHPQKRVEWLNKELPRTLKKVDFVITDSEIVKFELIDIFKVPEDKISTIYLGADERFTPRSAELTHPVLSKYGLTHGKYLLFVSTIEPRKGLSILLDAWEKLPEFLQKEYCIAIVGAPGWCNTEITTRITKLEDKRKIKHLKYVEYEDLPFIYSGAAALSYPSLYEGFGLPVLEAMTSGIPVICTDKTSMSEIAGNAALVHDAGDSDKLAELTEMLLLNNELRSTYSIKSLKQAKNFSWNKCVKENLAVYNLI